MTWLELIISCLIAYLVGAIPFSWLLVRFLKGVDLRTVGSGNLGSTNVIRVMGFRWGLVVQCLDILKGWGPVVVPALLFSRRPIAVTGDDLVMPAIPQIYLENALLAIGICAVLGHMFPIYMKFRGGKGVNTSIGVYGALAPKAIVAAAIIGVAVLAALRYVSLASMTGGVTLAVFVIVFYRDQTALVAVTIALAVLVIFMHRSNIRRLLAGTESKLGKRIAVGESNGNELSNESDA
jgi:glycerol-3-phosphate acyltransferase PlsY